MANISLMSKTSQFKTAYKDNSSYVVQLKQQKSKKLCYLSAHWLCGNLLLSNITLLIFAVVFVRRSCCRPYKSFVLNCDVFDINSHSTGQKSYL